MSKLDNYYISLLDYLFGQSLGEPKRYSEYLPTFFWRRIGWLQPLADIGKDFRDTFKPYKISGFGYDEWQFVYGIGNVLKGVLNIAAFPFTLVAVPVVYLLQSKFDFKNQYTNANLGIGVPSFLEAMSYPFAWFLEGITSLIRGVSQIVAQPLVWLIKMPLRVLITAFSPPKPLAEKNPSIQKLIEKAAKVVKETPDQHVRETINRDSNKPNGYVALWKVAKEGIMADHSINLERKSVGPSVFTSRETAIAESKKAKFEWLWNEVLRKYIKAVDSGQATNKKGRHFDTIFTPLETALASSSQAAPAAPRNGFSS